MSDKKNIVFIMADDLGYECIGANGAASYSTPNIDELASNGVSFRHCYSTPLCTPSRVQVMTGRYGFRNYEGFSFLNPTEITFGNVLRDAGYKTGIVGKWQLGGGASRIKGFGFDEHCVWNTGIDHEAPNILARGRYKNPLLFRNGAYIPDDEIDGKYGPDICSDFALDFIEQNKEGPFFLYYPMILVHSPFRPTPDSPEWTDPTCTRAEPRFYKHLVEYADKLVGRLLSKLKELKLLDNTLVVFTGDNGTPGGIQTIMKDGSVIGGGKGYMPDAGTHVPLIASLPGTSMNGVVSDDLVDFSDMLPTLTEVGEGKLPDRVVIDGRSILPQICGQKGDPRTWAYCHYDPQVPFGDWQEHSGRWARNQRYKLYHDGRFYDVPKDVLEKTPLAPDMSEESLQAHQLLQSAHGSMPNFEERGARFRTMSDEESGPFVREFINRR